MKPLIIQATEDTPEIVFDPLNNVFKISNVSLPENAIEFYMPVHAWLKKYREEPNPETIFDFNIEYLNTASSKQIFEMIFLIDKINENSKVIIRWHYDKIDEDMFALGLRFTNLVKVKFEMVEYEKSNFDEDRFDSEDDDDFYY
jgi:hypothetical protein